jgi:tRNA(Ile)-lysidine synthase
VHTLAQHMLEYIRRKGLLKAGDRLGVAVSGGADSVALLRLLLELRSELGIVLSVVHFNHKLRGAEADRDEQFVTELAQRHKLELFCASGQVAKRAAEEHLSLEAAARQMRYAYFSDLLREGQEDRIATAHTLDDQAETVLLKVSRGAGTRGLAGIYPEVSIQQAELRNHTKPGSIIRPLLATRRDQLEPYLNELGQIWREDKSNRDLRHARNRVRHGILPRLERNVNPAVRVALAETAEIARAEEEYWRAEVTRTLPGLQDEPGGVNLAALLALPLALQRRVVRAVGESLRLHLEFRHVEEILRLAEEKSGAAALPGRWRVTRSKTALQFSPAEPRVPCRDYEYPLPVPGCAEVPEAGLRLEALLVTGEAQVHDAEGFLDAGRLKELKVRNWRPGDRFWVAHSKAPRKIKELLQQRHVSGEERKLWPVVVCGNDVVWMRGFPASAQFRAGGGASQAVIIREVAGGNAPVVSMR